MNTFILIGLIVIFYLAIVFFEFFRKSLADKIAAIYGIISGIFAFGVLLFFRYIFFNFLQLPLAISAVLLSLFTIVAELVGVSMARKLYLATNKAISFFIEEKMSFLTAEANDLITRLLMKQNKNYLITYSSLLVSFIAEYVIYSQTTEFSMLIAMLLTLVLLALNFANQQILYYRLKHGLYGTCASEAREIIAYIIEQMNNKNNSGGGLPKLVFKEEELAERVLRTDGGEEYAG